MLKVTKPLNTHLSQLVLDIIIVDMLNNPFNHQVKGCLIKIWD